LFVIGGAQIYEAFREHIEKWIITEVPLTVQGADAFMPKDYLEGFEVVDAKPLGDDLVVKFYQMRG
jgi:dihydrofolate reductase